MAKLVMSLVKIGDVRADCELKICAAVESVVFEEGDEEIVFPEEYEGYPVVYVGAKQGYREGYMIYGDWHHSTHRGDEYVSPRYDADDSQIDLPPTVKRINIPKHAAFYSVEYGKGTEVVIHPENEHFALTPDGTHVLKAFLKDFL